MLLLGIDIGTSSIKVSIVDAHNKQVLASAQYPESESSIIAVKPGWAEQSPKMWWEHTKMAILKCNATGNYNPLDIQSIGIAYQMHGLVVVDKDQKILRNSIIWCDSRAVEIGNKAFAELGEEYCLQHLLNSPGNFTASKLAWIKENEPDIFEKTDKIMLPGDYISMELTGEVTASAETLSEGVFYDFVENRLSQKILNYFGFSENIIPEIREVFSVHGTLLASIAAELRLKKGIPVSYKAGDQPNNALSLNVLQPGEIAATAGTSGVIYGVSDQLIYDDESRINTFAHVNHSESERRLGALLCINGTGSMYRWMKNILGENTTYQQLNEEASHIPVGSNNLQVLPFGNGAERMLNNKLIGTQFINIDLNLHNRAHLVRATQEGIAFAFRYGFDIMKENGMNAKVIKAGRANLFLSDVFVEAFVNTIGVPLELYKNDGSVGAALGAGIGSGAFANFEEAFENTEPIKMVEPTLNTYEAEYSKWLESLKSHLSKSK